MSKTTITLLSLACVLVVTSVLSTKAQPFIYCDTMHDQLMDGSPTLYSVQGGGYIVGNNIHGDKAKAQHYVVSSPKQISEIAIWFAVKSYTSGNPSSSVTVNIYDMDGTGTTSAGSGVAPGTVLTSATLSIEDVDTISTDSDYFTYITFPTPITVTGDYAAGVDLTNLSPGDTVGIVCDYDGDGFQGELSWEKNATDEWRTLLSSWPLDVDLAIIPIECDDEADTTCSVSFVLYPDTIIQHHWFAQLYASGTSPIDYEWSWGDGTSSTGINPSHTYDSAGYYTICVTMTDAIGCTASYCEYDADIYKTDATMITVDVIAAPTGIKEAEQNLFNLYPNPATSTLTIELADGSGQWSVNIHNAQGQLVTSSEVEKPQTTIDISSFSSGIYFLTLDNGEQTVSRKFVKQ